MTAERWQKNRDLLASAARPEPAERSAFLERNCSADPHERIHRHEPPPPVCTVTPAFWEGSWLTAGIQSAPRRLPYILVSQ